MCVSVVSSANRQLTFVYSNLKMSPRQSAPKSRRITRSSILNETTNIAGLFKQEFHAIKLELNELTAKQQSELKQASENVAALSTNDCFFDLAKVKIEPTDENNKSIEDISGTLTTVDFNSVKNEQENEIINPDVALNDCQNRKIKIEPGSIQGISGTFSAVSLINVKKEEKRGVKYPYVLLNDCLNRKIKREPKFIEELTDPLATSVVTVSPVKKEGQIKARSSYVENLNDNIKLEPRRKSKRIHVKVAYETQEPDATDKKMLRSAFPKVKLEAFDGTIGKWEPPNWLEVIDNIRKMRKEQNAPIDIMGCHQWMAKGEHPKVSRYQTFVSLLLSSKTRDEANHAAMTRLREHGLTVERILETDEETIGKLISPRVAFWRVKSRYLLRATELLRQHHNDDVPKTVAKLISLPGVGSKMAHICMCVVWGKTTGIGVGSFVHRVANRLGWALAYEPEKTRLMLESWLPRSFWPEVNQLLVGFGQQMCQARHPRCHECLNAAKVMCPSAPLELYYHPV